VTVPLDPCGRKVEMLQRCYQTHMRFGSDPNQIALIQWYWADEDAPWLLIPTAFVSRNYCERPWPDVGEVDDGYRPWRDGSFPVDVTGANPPCGDPAVWRNGYQGTIPPIYHRNAYGLSLCCAGPMGQASLGILPYAPYQPAGWIPEPVRPKLRPHRRRVMPRSLSVPMPVRVAAAPWVPGPSRRLLPRLRPSRILTAARPAYPSVGIVPYLTNVGVGTVTDGTYLRVYWPVPTTPGNTLVIAWVSTDDSPPPTGDSDWDTAIAGEPVGVGPAPNIQFNVQYWDNAPSKIYLEFDAGGGPPYDLTCIVGEVVKSSAMGFQGSGPAGYERDTNSPALSTGINPPYAPSCGLFWVATANDTAPYNYTNGMIVAATAKNTDNGQTLALASTVPNLLAGPYTTQATVGATDDWATYTAWVAPT
jgi:hypothetical protein